MSRIIIDLRVYNEKIQTSAWIFK